MTEQQLPEGIAASPYRGLGVSYEGETAKELTQKAGLDWTVGITNHTYSHGGKEYLSDYQTVYREDNPEIEFGPVGPKWKPVQNEDMISTFLDFCKESKSKLLRVGSLKKGSIIWAIADTNQKFDVGGDEIDGLLLLHNAHIWGKGFKTDLLTWRQVCSNGMTVQLRVGNQVVQHTKSLTPTKIMSLLNSAHEGFQKYQEQSKLLAKTTLTLDEVYMFVIQQFGDVTLMNFQKPSQSDLTQQPSAVFKILNLYQGDAQGADLRSVRNGNAFTLLQAVTEYFNHHVRQRGGVETHVHSLWMESKATQQRKTMNGLLSMSHGRSNGHQTVTQPVMAF